MNLRILKKLSKRAAPYLPLLGDGREQFKSDRGDHCVSLSKLDFKHWKRIRSGHGDRPFRDDFKYKTKNGKWVNCTSRHVSPFKGTVIVGSMCGYYEPEWEDQTAYESLCELLYWHFAEYAGDDEYPVLRRDLSTPSLVFKAANEAIATKAEAA